MRGLSVGVRSLAGLAVVIVAIAAIVAVVDYRSGKPSMFDLLKYQQCGTERNDQGKGYDPKKRDCLWQVVSAGKPVEFTTITFTTEGDPITYTLRALAASHGPGPRFLVHIDSRDRFGVQGQWNLTCTGIQKYAGEPWHSVSLSGCTGSRSDSPFLM